MVRRAIRLSLVIGLALGGTMVQPSTAGASPLPRVSFIPASGATILVHGTYPKVTSVCVRTTQPILHARYDGTIEVGKDDTGKLFIIGVLSMEDYLNGIAEMPRTWSLEALKAQAVAARSYALAHMSYPDPTGEALGYQLCATTACQVYRGLEVADGPYGNRWRQAVAATAGQVLLYNGRPADTLYFSTSNGRTWGNESVFGTTPLPYLRPVTEKDDGASPVSHWQTRLRLSDLTRFLSTAGAWSGPTITSAVRSGANVTLSGGGASTTLDVLTFRSDVNAWAHCLEPDRYPTANATNGALLPQTVPSRWFTLSTAGGSAVLTGRGWGHGIGMVQWGAQGKAERGMSYGGILAAYYGGLRPEAYPEPSEIRIGIATGLSSVVVEGTGTVTVQGRRVGPGPWLLTGGTRLKVKHASAPPTYITSGELLSGPKRVRAGRPFTAMVDPPQTSVVSLVLTPAGGGPATPASSGVTLEPGPATVKGKVPTDLPPGTYTLQAQVTDGVDIVRTAGQRILVLAGPPIATETTPPPETSGPPVALPPGSRPETPDLLPWLAVGGGVLLVGGSLVLARRRRTRRPGAVGFSPTGEGRPEQPPLDPNRGRSP